MSGTTSLTSDRIDVAVVSQQRERAVDVRRRVDAVAQDGLLAEDDGLQVHLGRAAVDPDERDPTGRSDEVRQDRRRRPGTAAASKATSASRPSVRRARSPDGSPGSSSLEPEVAANARRVADGSLTKSRRAPARASHEGQQEPDRPGAHDHHDLALPDRGAADGVDRDGERLGEHCQIGVDPGRDPVDPVRIDRNDAREPAVDIDADEPELGAHVCLPQAAGDA